MKKKIKRNNSKSNINSKNSKSKSTSKKANNSNNGKKLNNQKNSNNINQISAPNSSPEMININLITKNVKIEDSFENAEVEEKEENAFGRKLNDEECLEKMKEKLPNDTGLTKTFITRKLRKKVMIIRLLDYSKFDSTVKNIETTIPKKSGPNNFIKFIVKTTSDDEFKLNSNLIYYLKDLFITNFIVLKIKDNEKKIIIAGSINKDIVCFLKKIATLEFKEKFRVTFAKVKAYAFYEELIYEFANRKDISSKNLTDEDINELLKQYEYLKHMRICYEEIKKIRISQ